MIYRSNDIVTKVYHSMLAKNVCAQKQHDSLHPISRWCTPFFSCILRIFVLSSNSLSIVSIIMAVWNGYAKNFAQEERVNSAYQFPGFVSKVIWLFLQPPYSLDLSSWDFFLFSKLTKILKKFSYFFSRPYKMANLLIETFHIGFYLVFIS